MTKVNDKDGKHPNQNGRKRYEWCCRDLLELGGNGRQTRKGLLSVLYAVAPLATIAHGGIGTVTRAFLEPEGPLAGNASFDATALFLRNMGGSPVEAALFGYFLLFGLLPLLLGLVVVYKQSQDAGERFNSEPSMETPDINGDLDWALQLEKDRVSWRLWIATSALINGILAIVFCLSGYLLIAGVAGGLAIIALMLAKGTCSYSTVSMAKYYLEKVITELNKARPGSQSDRQIEALQQRIAELESTLDKYPR